MRLGPNQGRNKTMTRQVAIFANGYTKEIKNSKRTYVYAWCWTAKNLANGAVTGGCGFSSQSHAKTLATAQSDYKFHETWCRRDGRPIGEATYEIVNVREG
jgi:hypothetical protein